MGNLDRVLDEAADAVKVFVFSYTLHDTVTELRTLHSQVCAVISQLCRGPWRLLTINVPLEANRARQSQLERLTPEVSMITMPVPGHGKVNRWFDPAIYNSAAGLAWEADLASRAREAFTQWMTEERR